MDISMLLSKITNILKIEQNIFYIATPIFIFFFILNLEFDRKMGNVWYRINSQGYKVFNIKGILIFFIKPFFNKHLWHFKLWTLNPYVSGYIFLLSVKYLLLYHSQDSK